MPWTGGLVFICVLSIASIPPFSGFIGEFLIIMSLIGGLSELSPLLQIVMVVVLSLFSLTGALTARTEGAELSHGVGYVLSKRAVAVPYARRYVVTEAMPLAIKPVRAWLRTQGVGRLTIKKRGVSVDPDALRRQLKLDGTGDHLTVILTRVGERQAFIVVEAT